MVRQLFQELWVLELSSLNFSAGATGLETDKEVGVMGGFLNSLAMVLDRLLS